MAFLSITFDKGDFPTKRDMNEALKSGWALVGRDYQRDRVPLHFDENADKRYRYSPRSPKYTLSKKNIHGHTRPLVWSGASVILSKIGRVTSTSKGARISIPSPALNRPKGGPKARARGTKKSMREEVTTVTQLELKEVAKSMKRWLNQRIEILKLRRRPKKL